MDTSATRAVMAVALAVLAGCVSDSASGGPGGGRLTVDAGDGQSAPVATALAPYSVLVEDPDGDPRAGVQVSWRVVSGGGAVVAATATSDAAGIATAVATLGAVAGPQAVEASASGFAGSPIRFQSTGVPGPAAAILRVGPDTLGGAPGAAVASPLTVRVTDQFGNARAGGAIAWQVTRGASALTDDTTTAPAADGLTSVGLTLGPAAGRTVVRASLGASAVQFEVMARAPFTILGGGGNVPERWGSDLWVANGYAYGGTWGTRFAPGNAVKIWQLGPGGAPTLADSIITPGIGTVSDIEVSPDGKWLVFSTEGGANRGLYAYELTAPGAPVFRARALNSHGLHTAALSVIGGKLFAFAAQDPAGCALIIYDLSAAGAGTIAIASSTPIPDNYCIHDTFVRDGYAFVFAWNEGLYIFDVGNGSHGGSPATPVQVSKTTGFGGETHNGWWFHNPNTGEKRYLFIGEEGPGVVGASSSGDIHVVDVSDLAAPREVGFFHLPGAGTHNFWMDEQAERLYAAYYNGGVVAIDVSGALSGDLSWRKIAEIRPGGGSTYVWGVMLAGGYLYVSDMVSGFWQLAVP
ncbi:MAG: hypothetical protein OEV95_08440 [Gemmatimonadota bacterium]|nr:hypothetical protein [Gemmatimonadota bacterium]